MDAVYERLIVRAATIDELLSGGFEALPRQKREADLAARRLAAWCRACASGDWSLFGRRLQRDGWSTDQVLAKFAGVCRSPGVALPPWIEDAIWIEAALATQSGRSSSQKRGPRATGWMPAYAGMSGTRSAPRAPCPFEHLFAPMIDQAEARLWAGIESRALNNFTHSARADLSHALLEQLTELCAPVLYERFVAAMKATAKSADFLESDGGTRRYDRFIADMKTSGFHQLFEDKPVLLRLTATITRQWLDASREFVLRLDADVATIRKHVLSANADSPVAAIDGGRSDPHNGGRAVAVVTFADGRRVVYKPKDLRLDVAWHALIERLNRAGAPIQLKAVRAIPRDGYGWTEFIDHAGCADAGGCKHFFRRAGAWLALFHCFAASDIHQENMIAAGEHPVPIDLETILQAADERHAHDSAGEAIAAAVDVVANSVMSVGLLPAYGRSPNANVFAMGGMTSDWTSQPQRTWSNINTDAMRPGRLAQANSTVPNLPHVDGRHARFGDHIDDFLSGFADYAKFLRAHSRDRAHRDLFDGFAGVPVRKVARPTRFYHMLLQRLRDQRTWDDGVVWSAQADFVARLADWDCDCDPAWPLLRGERAALLELNVPHFAAASDGYEIRDASGTAVRTRALSGMEHARARVENFTEQEIAWQIELIRQNTDAVSRSASRMQKDIQPRQLRHPNGIATPAREVFIAEADRIAADLTRHAIRRGPGAAWVGFDWLGDSEVSQLACLGPDLYNGASGIALFLAAHAKVTGRASSAELALAAIAHVRRQLKGANAARLARSLGIGGATGLGSLVYAFSVIARCLDDDALRADAHAATALFTDDLIAADKRLDVIGGSAGAILGLLRLYRDHGSGDVLSRAAKCGEHLLAQNRVGAEGRRSWRGQGIGPQPINGMSHGAAGFACALASLAQATGREEFARAACECIGFENASYDAVRHNWPDLRAVAKPWPSQWCHGAPGIGLARIATARRGSLDAKPLLSDVANATEGAEHAWPQPIDTLCCGTLGAIEFWREAGRALNRADLCDTAARRLAAVIDTAAEAGDYRWGAGMRQFNLGLFRGLAGVGYTCLRQADHSLPNVLIWE
jgi:type 2 lantibiotic biosynthesis protein LanM